MFSGKSGFYTEDVNSHSFTHKLSGLAKLAGVAAAGLVVSRPLLRAAGSLSVLFMSEVESGRGLATGVSKLIGASSTPSTVFENLISHESRFFADSLDTIEKSAITFTSNADRINSFLDGVQGYVKAESKDAFMANRDKLVNLVSEIGRADRGRQTESTFLKDTTLSAFNKQASNME